jgi:hypothetical protein
MSTQHTNMKDIFPEDPPQDQEEYEGEGEYGDYTEENHMYRNHETSFMDNIYDNKWIILLVLILCIGLYVYLTPSLSEKVKRYWISKPETPKYMETKLQNLEL